tara:strand:+ start:194 stop:955 length:762 start_codon:yes stop_codon:yes gene_type:complete
MIIVIIAMAIPLAFLTVSDKDQYNTAVSIQKQLPGIGSPLLYKLAENGNNYALLHFLNDKDMFYKLVDIAIASNNPNVTFKYAMQYEKNYSQINNKKSAETIISWYQKAAKQNHKLSKLRLASIYKQGKMIAKDTKVEKNLEKSFKYKISAAKQDPLYLITLQIAKDYEEGIDTKKDLVNAYALYFFEYTQSLQFDIIHNHTILNEDTFKNEQRLARKLQTLGKQLSRDEIFKARQIASKYIEINLEYIIKNY